MGDHKIPKIPVVDTIDGAIEAEAAKAEAADKARRQAELHAEFPDHLIADFVFNDDGAKMRIIVPNAFSADRFETAVSILMQMRVAADQAKKISESGGLVVPSREIVGVDGKRLS